MCKILEQSTGQCKHLVYTPMKPSSEYYVFHWTDIAIIYIDLGLKSHNTNGKFLSFVVFFLAL